MLGDLGSEQVPLFPERCPGVRVHVLEELQGVDLSVAGHAFPGRLGDGFARSRDGDALILGQHPFDAAGAEGVVRLLDLPEEAASVLKEVPTRGSFDHLPPTDPTIYRLYEVLQVYGPTIKALEGARVRITLDGKFLPYAW